jgi:myo-inositol-1(or 4)-monophosphatase
MLSSEIFYNVLHTATQNASELLKQYFSQGLEPQYKTSKQDLVTKADFESQNTIQQTITRLLVAEGLEAQEVGFIGEENDLDKKGKYLFAIDPIDGTTNFASGIDYFVISIGCFVDGERQFGILHEPLNNTTYFAEKGKGAYKTVNGSKTKLELLPQNLSNSLLATYAHSENDIRKEEFEFIAKVFPFIRGIRITGAGALDLAKLADNIFQVCYYGKSNIWDIAASSLVIEEAGGMIADLKGNTITFDLDNPKKLYPLIACHPANSEKLLSLL